MKWASSPILPGRWPTQKLTLKPSALKDSTITAPSPSQLTLRTLPCEFLWSAGFKAVSDESLVLRLPDEPGALAKVAERFKQAGVNIQSLHILERQAGHTIVALAADDRAKAETLVDKATLV